MSRNLYSPEVISQVQNLRHGDEVLHRWADAVHSAQASAHDQWSTAVTEVAERRGLDPRWCAARERDNVPQVGEWETPFCDRCEVVEVIGQPAFDCPRFSVVYCRPAVAELNWPEAFFFVHFSLADSPVDGAFRAMLRGFLREASDVTADGRRKGDMSGYGANASRQR